MLNHSSAKDRKETPHINKSAQNRKLNLDGTAKDIISNSTRNKTLSLNGTSKKTIGRLTKNQTLSLNGTSNKTISNALRRRAQSVINNNRSIDAQSRAVIRYALEINDPWLSELVRRADAGETIIYTVNSLKHPHPARMIQAKKRLKH